MNKNKLCKLVFTIEEETAPFCAKELDEAAAELSEEGLEVLVIRADSHEKNAARVIPSFGKALYFADSAALFQTLCSRGLPAAGYLHAGRSGESFQGASYLIERPQDIDRASYQKIYERAAGLPWTIAETDRCLIREMTVDDVESLYPLYEDEQARRFLKPLCPDHDKEREIVRAYIEKVYGLFGYGVWVVIRKTDGALIGRAGFEVGRKKEAALGYLFRKDCRRQGYALEVCGAVLRFAREELGFTGEDGTPLLTAYVEEENIASRRLLLRLGFMPAAAPAVPSQTSADALSASLRASADALGASPRASADALSASPRASAGALSASPQTSADALSTSLRASADALSASPRASADALSASPRVSTDALSASPQADEGALSVAPEAACGEASVAPEAACGEASVAPGAACGEASVAPGASCGEASVAPAVPAGTLRYVYRPAGRGVQ
ncbi:MAG: GNAT family N-acetyltransferase [Firmicutes bacterium]|nr:GNAT family N-acetyltransferase [Bacillota bacterium]